MLEMQETWVQYLGQEDPLEEEMATHFSIAAWIIPWTEEPGGLHVCPGFANPVCPWVRKQVDMTKHTQTSQV